MIDCGDEYHGPYVNYGGAVYRRLCPICARYAKADPSIKIMWLTETPADEPNGICKAHGRIKMPFEGWFSEDEWR